MFQGILKLILGIVLIWYGTISIYAGRQRHRKQIEYNDSFEKKSEKEQNVVVDYLLRFNEDNGYMLGLLLVVYGLDLIFSATDKLF